jgi:hypothetical protein
MCPCILLSVRLFKGKLRTKERKSDGNGNKIEWQQFSADPFEVGAGKRKAIPVTGRGGL